MQTIPTRLVAFAGAVAVSFGAAACGNTAPVPSPAAPSPAPSPASTNSDPSTSPTSASTSPSATPTSTDSSSSGPDVSSKAGEIYGQAKKNARAATSGALAGFITQGGERTTIDYRGTRDSKTVDVSISYGKGGKIRVIAVGGKGYVQGDKTFWTSKGQPATAAKVGNKFIEVPKALSSSLTNTMSLDKLALSGFESLTANNFAKDVGSETINGADCWVLKNKAGEGALYVSKDKNEIVRFTGTKKRPSQLDYSKWNEKVAVAAPPASQILKLG